MSTERLFPEEHILLVYLMDAIGDPDAMALAVKVIVGSRTNPITRGGELFDRLETELTLAKRIPTTLWFVVDRWDDPHIYKKEHHVKQRIKLDARYSKDKVHRVFRMDIPGPWVECDVEDFT